MDLQDLGIRLRALREAKGLTKYRLAKLSGVSQTYIYRIERGEIENPRRDTLQKLAQGLNIALAQLIGDTTPLESWQLVERNLKAYLPVYAELDAMDPIDFVACTTTEVPVPTVRGYRIAGLALEPEIRLGDTIIVDTALSLRDGDLVLAVRKDKLAIEQYHQNGKKKWFEAADGKHLCNESCLRGVIIRISRELRQR